MYPKEDRLIKESKRFILPLIVFTGYAILSLIVLLVDKRATMKEIAKISMFSFPVAAYFWFSWLTAIRYQLIISQDQILVITLFRRYTISMCNVMSYTLKENHEMGITYFTLYAKDKKLTIMTHFKEDLTQLFEDWHVMPNN